MSSNIVVVDYGSGNLMSVVNAFKHWSTDVIVSSELNDIKKAYLPVITVRSNLNNI